MALVYYKFYVQQLNSFLQSNIQIDKSKLEFWLKEVWQIISGNIKICIKKSQYIVKVGIRQFGPLEILYLRYMREKRFNRSWRCWHVNCFGNNGWQKRKCGFDVFHFPERQVNVIAIIFQSGIYTKIISRHLKQWCKPIFKSSDWKWFMKRLWCKLTLKPKTNFINGGIKILRSKIVFALGYWVYVRRA